MLAKRSSNIKRLDRDGRLTLRAEGIRTAWRVVAADRDRVDPTADYLFCAPDFLFPTDSSARALRLEIEPRAPARPALGGRSGRARRRT